MNMTTAKNIHKIMNAVNLGNNYVNYARHILKDGRPDKTDQRDAVVHLWCVHCVGKRRLLMMCTAVFIAYLLPFHIKRDDAV